MNKIAVVFSLSDIVIDNGALRRRAFKSCADQLKLSYTNELLHSLAKRESNDAVSMLMRHNRFSPNRTEQSEILRVFRLMYQIERNRITEKNIRPETLKLIYSLTNRGVVCALNCNLSHSQEIARNLNSEKYFDFQIPTYREKASLKKAFLMREQLSREGLRPFRCVLLVSTLQSVETGVAAGMKTVGVKSSSLRGICDLFYKNYSDISWRRMLCLCQTLMIE